MASSIWCTTLPSLPTQAPGKLDTPHFIAIDSTGGVPGSSNNPRI